MHQDQDTGLGHTYREPSSDGYAKADQAQMELLKAGHYGQNLMYYVNLYTFLEDPEIGWAKLSSLMRIHSL